MKNEQQTGVVRDADTEKNLRRHGRLSTVIPKVLCLIAAFVLWIYVMMVESPEYETTLNGFTVQIENEAALMSNSGLSLYDIQNDTVNLTLSGKKSVIDRIDPDDIRVTADISGATNEGRNSLDIFVSLPEGVSLVETNPKSVTVYVAQTASVSVPVKASVAQFNLESPYELGNMDPEYDSITVTGPRDVVESVSSAKVSVDVAGRTSSFVQSCAVQLCDKDGGIINQSFLKLSASEMQVRVNINFSMSIPITAELKYGLVSSDMISIKTVPNSVTVRGDGAVISSGVELMEPIVIDEKSIPGDSNRYTVTKKPKFADGVSADGLENVTVNVEFDSSFGKKDFVVTNIKPVGASDSLKYEILDESKNVTLRGIASILANVKESDISLEVDLSGYQGDSSGVVDCPVKVNIDSKYSNAGIFEAGSYSVRVRIGNE